MYVLTPHTPEAAASSTMAVAPPNALMPYRWTLNPSSSGSAELEVGDVASGDGAGVFELVGVIAIDAETAVALLLGGGALVNAGLDAVAEACSSAACAAGIPRPSLRGGVVGAVDETVAAASLASKAARCRRKYINGTASAAEVTANCVLAASVARRNIAWMSAPV